MPELRNRHADGDEDFGEGWGAVLGVREVSGLPLHDAGSQGPGVRSHPFGNPDHGSAPPRSYPRKPRCDRVVERVLGLRNEAGSVGLGEDLDVGAGDRTGRRDEAVEGESGHRI